VEQFKRNGSYINKRWNEKVRGNLALTFVHSKQYSSNV